MRPTARSEMRTRPEVGFDAADEEGDLIVDGLIHYSAFPVVLGRLSNVAYLKNLQPLVLVHRHYHHNRPSMLGDRHRLARARWIGRPKPYFASFALKGWRPLQDYNH